MKSTRERLQTKIVGMSSSIKQLRLDFVKAACYRDVLVSDLASETGERSQVPSNPLSSNTEDAPVRHSSSELVHNPPADFPSTSCLVPANQNQSICESLHSILDFSTEWPQRTRASSTFLRKSTSFARLSSEAMLSTSTASNENPSSTEPSSSRQTLSVADAEMPKDSDLAPSTSRVSGDEQAEEWDKTKAARRVSLVRVPGELRSSGRSLRSERAHSPTPEVDVQDPTEDHPRT